MSSMAISVIVLGCVVGLRLPESLAGFGDAARPLLLTVTVAGAASFRTPVAAPVDLTVSEARGHRFGDYGKLGLPLLLIVVGVLLVPILWRF
jgi:di/tricarboxylate transporter